MTRFFLKRPVMTWVLFAALVVLGAYALPKLRIESMPEVELPSLTITTTWTGASPAAVQRAITVPVEEAVRRVRGIESVVARSYPAYSSVEVSFRRDVDIEFAHLELAEQVGAVRRQLPLNSTAPQISGDAPEEFATSEFFTVSLISPLDPNALRDLAEKWIIPQLMSVPGVASAEVRGGADRLLRIVLDRERLQRYSLTPDAVLLAVMTLDDIASGGVARDGPLELLVSIRDDSTLEGIANLPVIRTGERPLRIGDLGTISWDYEDPSYLVRVNGENMVQLHVEKRRGSNAVTVSRALRARLPEIERGLPFPASFEVDQDEGGDLESKLTELVYRSLVILGILLVFLLASLRNLPLAGMAVASILFAVVISLSLFYFFGVSVNFITISGLACCFGFLIENSILVLDSVERQIARAAGGGDRKHRSRLTAAQADEAIATGAGQVTLSILGASLTTIVAFLSFVFLSGRIALYYSPLAIAVAVSTAASIFVSLAWVPVALRSWWVRPVKAIYAGVMAGGSPVNVPGQEPSAIERTPGDPQPHTERRLNLFERYVRLTLRGWWVVFIITAASLVGAWYIYQHKVDKGGFWQMPERETLYLGIRLPEGTDIQMTYETMLRFESEIVPLPEGVRSRLWVYRNRGGMQVTFENDDVLYSELPLLYRSRLIDMGEKMAGMGIYIQGFADQAYIKGFFGGINFNSTVKITGYNSKTLEHMADGVLRSVSRNRRVRQARVLNDLQNVYTAQDESIITIRRDRLEDYGLTVTEVVAFVRRLIGLDYPVPMVIEGEAERVQLSYNDSETIEFAQLTDQIMQTRSGRSVRLGDVLTLETVPLAGPIVREDQRYAKYITWEYIGTEPMRARYLQETLARIQLPYGYTAEETTQQFLTQEEESQLTLMLVLSVVFIYMILAALFESVGLPMLILLAVPMSLVGVVGIFWLSHSTFDSSARIGLVLLYGNAVDIAILLVARYRIEAQEILARLIPKAVAGAGGGVGEGIGASSGDGARNGDGSRAERPRSAQGAFSLRQLPRGERVRRLQEIIVHGTNERIRSILLVTSTTVAGMIPLLIHFKRLEGKDIWENLALSSIGGLASGLILIVLALPAAYYVAVRMGWFVADRVSRRASHG